MKTSQEAIRNNAIGEEAFRRKLLVLVLPITIQQLMLALVGASTAVMLAIGSGIGSGALIVILIPMILRGTKLSSASTEYLKAMLLMCSYYMVGKSVNGTTIAGIFCIRMEAACHRSLFYIEYGRNGETACGLPEL